MKSYHVFFFFCEHLQMPHFKADLGVKHFWGLKIVVLDIYLKHDCILCTFLISYDPATTGLGK